MQISGSLTVDVIFNGRCHSIERSMPFITVVANVVLEGRWEKRKTGYFAQLAFWEITVHLVQNGGRSTRGGEDRWRSGH